jgi:hypothetical protein
MNIKFDQKFGTDFILQLPDAPGSYRAYTKKDELFYVGKAKSLRKRLSQYRSAGSNKEHARMRRIVRETARWEWEMTATLEEAELLELRWIQQYRPKFNLTGAFSRIYPYFGLHSDAGKIWFSFSHRPEVFAESCQVFGAWRSRATALEAFEAMGSLLNLILRPLSRKETFGSRSGIRGNLERSARIYAWSGVSDEWRCLLSQFFMGESKEAISLLSLELLDSTFAREKSVWVEKQLKCLRAFYREEARDLLLMRKELGIAEWPISQIRRDEMRIQLRHKRNRYSKDHEPNRKITDTFTVSPVEKYPAHPGSSK